MGIDSSLVETDRSAPIKMVTIKTTTKYIVKIKAVSSK